MWFLVFKMCKNKEKPQIFIRFIILFAFVSSLYSLTHFLLLSPPLFQVLAVRARYEKELRGLHEDKNRSEEEIRQQLRDEKVKRHAGGESG